MNNPFDFKYNSKTILPTSRRDFIKNTVAITATTAFAGSLFGCNVEKNIYSPSSSPIPEIYRKTTIPQSIRSADIIGFNSERRDSVTKNYNLGNGTRTYNPLLMRFNSWDKLSPFGKGGINGYAYCLGDPINQRDPSGHFAIMSLVIGAIIGAVVGASISAAAEGISSAVQGRAFDWKQVGIGAALGLISGGFGAAAQGGGFAVKLGLALGDAAISGSADYGLNVAAGMPARDAANNAIIGAVIGFGVFLIGTAIRSMKSSSSNYRMLGGNMQETLSPLEEVVTYSDTYKGKARLNIDAHGYLKGDGTGGMLYVNACGGSEAFSIDDIIDELSSHYDLSQYSYLRTVTCYSGNGGVNSLGAQLSQKLGMPVKSYVGLVTASGMQDAKIRQLSGAYSQDAIQAAFAQAKPMQIRKVNPFSFFFDTSNWWKYTYGPVHFGY